MISPQYRPIVGGYERAAERLSAALVAQGHSVTVIAERRESAWSLNEVQDGVTVRRLWCFYRPKLHMLTALSSYAFYLLTEGRDYDVWHVHQYGLHAVLAIIIGMLIRRPVVLKLTSSSGQGLAYTMSKGRFAVFISAMLKRISAVVALTRETASEAQAFGISQERIHVLGNGVDTAIFHHHDERERLGLKDKLGIGAYPTVIFVGRLSKEKNPDGLVMAWKRASALLAGGWKLVIVGHGPMRQTIAALVREQGLEKSVILAGQQYNIEEWMAAGDIYVTSSHNEGLSNTLLEAMACGLPVVATRVSGVTEVVEEPGAGLVVEVEDMESLADALVRLASDSLLRKKMGLLAQQVIEKRYVIDIVAERHAALYRQLL